MGALRRNLGGVLVALLLVGLPAVAWGQGPGGGGVGAGTGFGGEFRGMVRLRGVVTCVGCTLDEARQAHPEFNNLYELRHDKGPVVMQVTSVNNTANRGSEGDGEITGRFTDIIEPPLIAVRAEDELFQRLLKKENRMKEVEITGILHPSRTLDIVAINVSEGRTSQSGGE